MKIFFFPRLHGSYEALKYGTSLDGLSDLTGGIAESILLKPSYTSLLTTLNNLLKMTSIVLCKWDKDNQSDANQSVSAYFEKKNKKTKKIAAFFFQDETLTKAVRSGESYRIYSLHKVLIIILKKSCLIC